MFEISEDDILTQSEVKILKELWKRPDSPFRNRPFSMIVELAFQLGFNTT